MSILIPGVGIVDYNGVHLPTGGGLAQGAGEPALVMDRSNNADHITSQAPFQYWDDVVTSASYIYYCSAPAGTETSAAGWRIARYEIATGKTMYADGDTKFDNVADDRVSLTYSFT